MNSVALQIICTRTCRARYGPPANATNCALRPACRPHPPAQFCQCPPALSALRPHGTDDMLFFVYTDEAAAAARSRLFVRRRQAKAAALPADLAAAPTVAPARGHAAVAAAAGPAAGASKAGLVDWRASVLLMLVLQTAFRLSVVTADDPELLNAALEEAEVEPEAWGRGPGGGGAGGGAEAGRYGGGASSRLRRVTKVVHASPRWAPCARGQGQAGISPRSATCRRACAFCGLVSCRAPHLRRASHPQRWCPQGRAGSPWPQGSPSLAPAPPARPAAATCLSAWTSRAPPKAPPRPPTQRSALLWMHATTPSSHK